MEWALWLDVKLQLALIVVVFSAIYDVDFHVSMIFFTDYHGISALSPYAEGWRSVIISLSIMRRLHCPDRSTLQHDLRSRPSYPIHTLDFNLGHYLKSIDDRAVSPSISSEKG